MSEGTLAKTLVRGWPTANTNDPLSKSESGRIPASPEELAEASYCEFGEPVYLYLARRFGHPADAEEVTQETFLRVYRELEAGRPIYNMRGWVFTTAFHLMIDRLDSIGRRKLSEISLEMLPNAHELFADRKASIEEILADQASLDRLKQAVIRLPAVQRECISLRAEGKRLREISAVLGIDYRRVAEAIGRAVVTLQRILND